MRRFNMLLTEGHMKAVKRILSSLMTFTKGRLIADTKYPDYSILLIEDHTNWMEFYPGVEEAIPNVIPTSKGQKLRTKVYVDVDYAHDLVSR
jgi:hypothetical protein